MGEKSHCPTAELTSAESRIKKKLNVPSVTPIHTARQRRSGEIYADLAGFQEISPDVKPGSECVSEFADWRELRLRPTKTGGFEQNTTLKGENTMKTQKNENMTRGTVDL